MLTVKSIAGVEGLPGSFFGVRKWLTRMQIPTTLVGKNLTFAVTDLPAPVRIAYLTRELERSGMDAGKHDAEAHARYLAAPAGLRAEADRRAAIVHEFIKLPVATLWSDRAQVISRKFGAKGTDTCTLRRYLQAVKGVDPINFAPALLRRRGGGAAKAETTPEAWSFFMTVIRDAAPTFPLVSAWRDVRDVAPSRDWHWPSYPTVFRRWTALPEAQKLRAQHGTAATAKRLAQPAHRDKTTLRPLDCVSLDGRTQDYWTDMGDGRAVRLTMLILTDVASNMVLGHVLTPSENAVATLRLIRDVCQRHGIFDVLYTDNGSAFAGHLVAGGTGHKFRNAATNEGLRPLGICQNFGIDLKFALPGNAQAKIAERTFASLSRVADDRPEFKDAHAGHAPGAAPDVGIVPVPLATVEAVISRELARHNRETGRRGQGKRGRSYRDAFEDGIADRIVRRPTARQLYLASLIYKPVAVDRVGQVRVNGFIYGSHTTQEALLPYHGNGQRVLIGRDPDDLSAPAMAFDPSMELICEGIEAIQRGPYASVDGIRTAAHNRKAARDTAQKAIAANDYMTDHDLTAALAAIPTEPEELSPAPPAKVVGARFGSPLRERKVAPRETVPEEFYRNMDAALRANRAKSDKLA